MSITSPTSLAWAGRRCSGCIRSWWRLRRGYSGSNSRRSTSMDLSFLFISLRNSQRPFTIIFAICMSRRGAGSEHRSLTTLLRRTLCCMLLVSIFATKKCSSGQSIYWWIMALIPSSSFRNPGWMSSMRIIRNGEYSIS
jgi:hypothetical protein